jgi:hypothetical protein
VEGVQFLYDALMGRVDPQHHGCILAGKNKKTLLSFNCFFLFSIVSSSFFISPFFLLLM